MEWTEEALWKETENQITMKTSQHEELNKKLEILFAFEWEMSI